jgi:hypothetical protein
LTGYLEREPPPRRKPSIDRRQLPSGPWDPLPAPRLLGAAFTGCGAFLLWLEASSVNHYGTYGRKGLAMLCLALALGLWLLIVGDPVDEESGEAHLGPRIGLWTAGALGLGLGLTRSGLDLVLRVADALR